MHSLVIDGWPFYIGLGVLVVHLSLYWLNQWRKIREKNAESAFNKSNIPISMLIMNLQKKMQKIETDQTEAKTIITKLYSEYNTIV